MAPSLNATIAANQTPGLAAVSWPAIFGGAVVAAALTLILITLGAGVGLSSVSPYGAAGASATSFTITAAIWLIVVQIIAAGLGGYLAGRLRTRWSGVHTDEVYFRDTAHGLMVWALGAIVSAGLLASTAGSLIGTTAQAGGSLVTGIGSAAAPAVGAAGEAATNNAGAVQGYFTDMLFRSDKPSADPTTPATLGEVGRIMTRSLADGAIAPNDKGYVAQLVAAKTGLSQADAEKRVEDTIAQAKAAEDKAASTARQVAETARKAGVYLSLWLFAALLCGAFAASYAATLGGRARDAILPAR